MNSRYPTVAERAAHRCEYCRAPESVFNFPFEVEHVIPRSLDGSDEEGNLALSCRSCNLRKGSRVRAVDPESGADVPLFDPRNDRWDKHFRVESMSATVVGLTAIGRATVAQLSINGASQVAARRQWLRLGLFT